MDSYVNEIAVLTIPEQTEDAGGFAAVTERTVWDFNAG